MKHAYMYLVTVYTFLPSFPIRASLPGLLVITEKIALCELEGIGNIHRLGVTDYSLNIFSCQNWVGLQVLTTLVSTLPLTIYTQRQ